MADDVQTLRSLNWRALFPFLNLFDAFKVAMHPSKLALGFLLLLFVYAGGRLLDKVWPAGSYAISNEIDQYDRYRWSADHFRSFDGIRDEKRASNADAYARDLMDRHIVTDEASAVEAAYLGEYRDKLQSAIVQDRNQSNDKAKKDLDDDLKKIAEARNPNPAGDAQAFEFARAKQQRLAHDAYAAKIRDHQTLADQEIRDLAAVSPRPLFDTFFEFEVRQFHNTINNALSLHWLNGVLGASGDNPAQTAGNHQEAAADPSVGVVRSLVNFVLIGPGWLLRYHTVFFLLFAGWFLVIWAIFGGAISRIAAVHMALDEKMSIRKALRFSTGKLLSFVFAPLIPLIFVLIVGLILAAGGLLLYVPAIGPIALGAFFILALFGGFLITLALTGTLAGSGLMFPTIAVEGSDSFDAISKSCSYVFMRPWKMLFYSAVSLVYGAICFLFVRFFVFAMLWITHSFVGRFLVGKPGLYWPEIWPPVSTQNLSYQINFQALAWSEKLAAVLIAMWVYVVLAFLAAFVISFYFSANTIIYYLMRRQIDTNEMSEVYLEEGDEDDWGEPAAPAPETPKDATAKTGQA